MADVPRDPDDEAMVGYARDLVSAVEAAIGPWIRRAVVSHHRRPWPDTIEIEIERATGEAVTEIGNELRRLLALDIDQQWTNPLSIIRSAVRYPTSILAALGAEPAARDSSARRLHPGDIYDLSPASFADLGPDVREPGLVWGAAKAHVHLRRRKPEEFV